MNTYARSSGRRRMLLAGAVCTTMAAFAGGVPVSAHEGHDDREPAVVIQGPFSAASQEGEGISGFAKLVTHHGETHLVVELDGLEKKAVYPAHLHRGYCIEGGGHYAHDPAGEAAPPNELWPSSDPDDPTAGLQADKDGAAHGHATAPWVARPDAKSVAIHAPMAHDHDEGDKGEEAHGDETVTAAHAGEDHGDPDGEEADPAPDDADTAEEAAPADKDESAEEHEHAAPARLACADLT